MVKCSRVMLCMMVGVMVPQLAGAQGIADEMNGLHGVLEQLYNEMIPLCSKLISVGQGIAGFAATWYIGSRVWKHIANAEPIDFYPLFRPFVLGFCIMAFPSVLAMINGVMKPTVTATAEMVKGSKDAIATLLKQKEEALKKTDRWQMYVGDGQDGDRNRWYQYTYGEDPTKEGVIDGIGNSVRFAMEKASYNFRNSIKEWMSQVLNVLFEAAALCIDTLRTFQLVVLAILGPLVFGLSVFDGFQHTLSAWLAKYLNIFLWLPVANIFGAIIGKIQEQMIKLDLGQLDKAGDTFFSSTDIAYLVFMIIGIVGYFTVPSVANSIINAGGAGSMLHRVTNLSSSMASSVGGYGASNAMATGGAIANMGNDFQSGYNGQEGKGMTGAVGKNLGKAGAYMADKLSGNSK